MLFIMAMWLVFYLDYSYRLDLNEWGTRPRTLSGIIGIVSTPLLHGDLGHLISNTLPILVLGTFLFYYYRETAYKVFFISYLAGNAFVWLFARGNSVHIGASGLVYAMAGFLFFSGILRRHRTLFGVSLLVTFLYGTIVWGVLPTEFLQAIHYMPTYKNISWEGHLFGFLCGIGLAFAYRHVGLQEPQYDWQKEKEDDTDDTDPYWMVDENVKPNESEEDILKNTSDNPITVKYTFVPKKEEEK